MKELTDILDAWSALRAAQVPAVLATVVKLAGSGYRRPGARLLLTKEGRRAGLISGGCLESHLADVAWGMTEGRPIVVTTYDTTSDEDVLFGSGAGCRGVIDVMLERLEGGAGPERMAFRDACRTSRRTGVLSTVIGQGAGAERVGQQLMLHPDGTVKSTITDAELSRHVLADAGRCALGSRPEVTVIQRGSESVEVFHEVIAPSTALLVFGAGPDAAPLVRMAKELGWYVSVMDQRSAFLTRQRFPQADRLVPITPGTILSGISIDPETAAVVMSHDYLQDHAVLEALAAQPLKYLGVLGPRSRTSRLLSELPAAARDALRDVYAPVGLDLGAETPEEIALAILAEIQAVLRGGTGGGLRGRAAIHRGSDGSEMREESRV